MMLTSILLIWILGIPAAVVGGLVYCASRRDQLPALLAGSDAGDPRSALSPRHFDAPAARRIGAQHERERVGSPTRLSAAKSN
jgi:hypothetical protein